MKNQPYPTFYRNILRVFALAGPALIIDQLVYDNTAVAAGDETPIPANERPDTTPRSSLRLSPLPPDDSATARDDGSTRPGQLGLTVGIPFFDDDILHGDLTVDVRYGHKFWWLVPYLSGGFRQTRMDPSRVPSEAEKKKLLAWHVTLGLRLEIPATPKLYPFVGMAGELDYWAYTADSTSYCKESFYPDAWRCYEPFNWKAGRALKPQLGLLYKPEPSLALEFWVEYATVDAKGMFTRRVTFFNPAVGVAWHH